MGLVWYCIDDPPCQVNIHTFLNFYLESMDMNIQLFMNPKHLHFLALTGGRHSQLWGKHTNIEMPNTSKRRPAAGSLCKPALLCGYKSQLTAQQTVFEMVTHSLKLHHHLSLGGRGPNVSEIVCCASYIPCSHLHRGSG